MLLPDSLQEWFCINKLQLNAEKCKEYEFILDPSSKTLTQSLLVKKAFVYVVKSAKDLAISSNLTWNEHDIIK
jgi:adenylate kinase family enzyme